MYKQYVLAQDLPFPVPALPQESEPELQTPVVPQDQNQASTDERVLLEVFGKIATKIIEQQEAIIGPIAVEQAKQIQGLTIDWSQHQVTVTGEPRHAIDELVEKYKVLFGQIAVQVSREATMSFLSQLPTDQKPKSLS